MINLISKDYYHKYIESNTIYQSVFLDNIPNWVIEIRDLILEGGSNNKIPFSYFLLKKDSTELYFVYLDQLSKLLIPNKYIAKNNIDNIVDDIFNSRIDFSNFKLSMISTDIPYFKISFKNPNLPPLSRCLEKEGTYKLINKLEGTEHKFSIANDNWIGSFKISHICFDELANNSEGLFINNKIKFLFSLYKLIFLYKKKHNGFE